MKIQYWRDARGIELARVRLGPASFWLQMSDALSLVLVVSGQGWAHCRGDLVPLSAGTAFFGYPHEVAVSRATQEPLVLGAFHVPRDVLRSTGADAREGEALAARPHDDLRAIAASVLERLVDAGDGERGDGGSGSGGRGDGVPPSCDELLPLLPDARTVALGRPKPHVLEPGPVRRARLFLERNFRASTSLDELATESGASKYHLVRMFRAYHGIPPHTYLTTYRLAIARRMLADGVRGSDAAVATGFADQSHFSRSFRRMLGISPHTYARLGARDDVPLAARRPRDEPVRDA